MLSTLSVRLNHQIVTVYDGKKHVLINNITVTRYHYTIVLHSSNAKTKNVPINIYTTQL